MAINVWASCKAIWAEKDAASSAKGITRSIVRYSWLQLDSNPHHKRTLNQLSKLVSLAKWLSVGLGTKCLWIRVQLQSLKRQISRLLRAMSSLTFRQLYVWIHSETRTWHDKKIQLNYSCHIMSGSRFLKKLHMFLKNIYVIHYVFKWMKTRRKFLFLLWRLFISLFLSFVSIFVF